MEKNEKLRVVVLTLLFVMVCSLLTSCHQKQEQPQSGKITAKELYPLRVSYIGDNSKVGALLTALHINYEGIEIHSKEAPYGLTVYLSKSEWKKEKNISFQREAALILGLIENANFITFTDENQEYGQYYDLEGIGKELGYSPKVFYQNQEKLEEFLKKDSQP